MRPTINKRLQRHKRIRSRIEGSTERPRVAVFRSNRYISAQVIDDSTRKTLFSAKGDKSKSEPAGEDLGKRVMAAGIKKIVFDRGGHKYHGGVKAFADGLRKAGLEF